jgi:hypothetical protein
MRSTSNGHSVETDRRRKVRVPLALTVYLLRVAGKYPIECKTRDLSSEGFFCLVPEPLAIAEPVRCVLVFPAFDPQSPRQTILIESQARVVRVEQVGAGQYGTGFLIEEYRVISRVSQEESTREALQRLLECPGRGGEA